MFKTILRSLAALAAIAIVGGFVWFWLVSSGQRLANSANGPQSAQLLRDSQAFRADAGHSGPEATVPRDGATNESFVVAENTVVLTAEKVADAQIALGRVEQKALQARRTIAGRVDYDQDLHVAIKSACDGILTEIRVQPGDEVKAGQIVAMISSPEVGMARAEVRSRINDAKLAETRSDWQSSICRGVEELAQLVQEGRSPQEISSKLQDDSLGAFREKIFSAYTRARLATKTADNTRQAADLGAIAGTLQQQRESELQSANAALASELEQSLFEVQQQCKVATAEFEQAQRLVDIGLQKLNTLLGPAAQSAERAQFENDTDKDALSLVSLVSPIDGSIEDRNFSVSERVVAGDAVFSVANVSQLWAVGDVRERDWEAITVGIGEIVQIQTPAIPDRNFSAEVIRVGRRVDPATGAAPLIARLEAYDRRLRPGLFIRMTIPISAPRRVLCVPEQAVVVHDGKHFVFLAENSTTFHRQDVQVGENQDGLTEILSGLTDGQTIAVQGVFQLKSELLLAGEEE